jgi:ATP-dependent DNA ligase
MDGQAEAILVAYDIMEVDGRDVRPEPLEQRRKRPARLLCPLAQSRDVWT